ncbi:protein TIC 22-like, chloroplastic [Sesamum indicum]|uniref:Protein TIC 22-like, chloroplastic n=1 Tax=Sesamum indicum TaxID=4182 RepID=A0A6I9UM68_SESIN|nr:protein TIC 22-like, chloroplastic [Sesamum indicum]
MSAEAIEERLAGVPVYALSNGEKFVLVSGTNTGKNLGLFCFSEADAETLLKHMKSVDPSMSSGSQVVAVALSKIFQLDVDGVALRLMPEASQIRNALMERKNAGISDESFAGVPVFQSKSLILRSQNKRYRPVFFRKEDLEKSLSRASNDQKQFNPSLRRGDIQVAVLEDIIQGMKDSSVSTWDDVVFIPPGFDVSTDPSRQY